MRAPSILVPACLLTLSALLALPAHAQPGPRGPVTFEAPDLHRREARDLRDPVVVDRLALERQLDALARELDTLRRQAEPPRGRRKGPAPEARPELRAAAAQLVSLRDSLKRAPRLTLQRGPQGRPMEPPPAEPVIAPIEALPQAIDAAALGALVESIDAGSFPEDKLRVIRRAAERNHFTCAQVSTLVERLSFGKDKIEAIVALYPAVIDPENDHTFDRLLSHASERKTLDAQLKSLRR